MIFHLVAGILALAWIVPAQTLEFEVSSVKPSGQNVNGVKGGCHGVDSKYRPNETSAPPLGRCVITDARLSHLIGIAWNVKNMGLIKGASDWMIGGWDRFNVEAKAEDPEKATEAQLLQMLQALLIERFQLKFRGETKEMPGYALVVSKGGPKSKEAKGDEVVTSFGGVPKPMSPSISLMARKYSMPVLVNLLSQIAPGPVIDQTGLNGAYDFELSWDEDAGPSVFTALRQQLGLQLEPRHVPVT
jgi:uncharacterized protein (TIGR03435 family)